MATAKGSKGDAGRNELIRVGGSLTAIADMFDKDVNAVKRIIAQRHIAPNVSPDGRELYAIRDVAPYLIDVSAVVDIAEIIKNTPIRKLPPELTKNYWESVNARKKHLEDIGELWRTEAVMEVFLDAFKTIRQSVNQFVDTVADRTEITDKQRQLLTEMCDSLLATAREKLIEKFELYEPRAEEKDTDDGTDD